MILNCFEHSTINNEKLPISWQSKGALEELEDFLQQNWDQRAVFYDDQINSSKQQFLEFKSHLAAKTKNYIGTVSFKGDQLNIYPKVFRENASDNKTGNLSSDHLMKNLIQWLEYCNKLSYPFINISTELKDAKDLRELFITLYVGYVKAAVERGLFYRYVEEDADVSTIKGKFDYKDYIMRKIPNGMNDKFRCSYSTFEFDNWINRIIKYTCKQLYNSTSGRNQKIIRTVLVRMNEVSDVSCVPNDCDRVRLSKMHSNYRVIMSMSRMFLLNKTTNLSIGANESFCFLFPAELLFEGFIGGFIQEVVEDAAGKVALQKNDMRLIQDIQYRGKSLGSAFTMKYDIFAEIGDKAFILDTKYKQVSRFEGNDENVLKAISEETKQADLYQVCEYARIRGINDVFLLYPMYRYESREPSFPIGISEDIIIHFVRLPFVFDGDFEVTKQHLTDVIKEIVGITEKTD